MSKSNGVKMLVIDNNQDKKKKQREVAVKILKALLADEMLLYTKLRNYHWNVTGVHFYTLHAAFETQFKDIAEISDVIAEQIRQYGVYAPGTMDEFVRKTRLSEDPNDYPNARTMVTNLVNDHETLIRFLTADIDNLHEETEDFALLDLLTGFLQQHGKMTWALRMYLYQEEKPHSEEE